MDTKELFLDAPKKAKRSIVLIDTSGSTGEVYDRQTGQTVLQKQGAIISKLLESEEGQTANVIFWGYNNTKVIGFPLRGSQIGPLISAQITPGGGTAPHEGLAAIPVKWLQDAPKDAYTEIYLVTDGIAYDGWKGAEQTQAYNAFAAELKRVCGFNPMIRFNIWTVESIDYDMKSHEQMKKAAGSDLLKLINEKNLAAYVHEFKCHARNVPDGFHQINRTGAAPAGQLVFRGKFFMEQSMGLFSRYIDTLIKEIHQSEALDKKEKEKQLLEIMQDLVPTLSMLTKTKPRATAAANIRVFVGHFLQCADIIEPAFVDFMLHDFLTKENAGYIQTFAEKNARLTDLFKQTDQMLLHSVTGTMGCLMKSAASLPVSAKGKDSILYAPAASDMLRGTLTFTGKIYNHATWNYPGLEHVGFVPLPSNEAMGLATAINAQAARQYTRICLARRYNVAVAGDIAPFLVQGVALATSQVPALATGFKNLASIMWDKARKNTNSTEREHIKRGFLPTPFSQSIPEMEQLLREAAVKTGLVFNEASALSPYTIWYLLCLAFNDSAIEGVQWQHCEKHVLQDCKDALKDLDDKSPGVPLRAALLSFVHKRLEQEGALLHADDPESVIQLSADLTLDYSECPVTLEDVSQTGGYAFKPHRTTTNQTCCPIQVLSATGYRDTIEQADLKLCIACFSNLTAADFRKVGPMPRAEGALDKFKAAAAAGAAGAHAGAAAAAGGKKERKHAAAAAPAAPTSVAAAAAGPVGTGEAQCRVIFMHGTVGAGKSTLAHEIIKALVARGKEYKCITEGTDKYMAVRGTAFPDALRNVTSSIQTFVNQASKGDKGDTYVLIVDICGERETKMHDVFGVNLTASGVEWKPIHVWPNFKKERLAGYLAWSLQNVLNRDHFWSGDEKKEPVSWCLSPPAAGAQKCKEVHAGKACALFPAEQARIRKSKEWNTPATRQAYQDMLDKEYTLEIQTQAVLDQL